MAFANLLLAAAAAEEGLPVYVVITMRSDFLGDCTQIPGLPEAINAGPIPDPAARPAAARTGDRRAGRGGRRPAGPRRWCSGS